MAKFLGENGLQYLWSKIKLWTSSNFISRVRTSAGKHTTIDIQNGEASFNVPTTAEHIMYDANTTVKAKVDTIVSQGGEPNTIDTISLNGTNIAPDSNKNVDIKIIGKTIKVEDPVDYEEGTNNPVYSSYNYFEGDSTIRTALVNLDTALNNKTDTDTKNTAGATDSSSKMFVVGATALTANPLTYTQDTVWIGTDGKLHSGVSGTNPTATLITNSTVVTNSDITYDMSLAGSDLIAIIDKTTGKVKPSGDSFDSLLQDYPSKVNGVSPNSNLALVNLATCSTAANTIAKTASLTSGGTLYLETGTQVVVKFENKNTANSPTLNIDNKGAKEIHINGSAISGELNAGVLNNYVLLEYDGTYWNIVGPTTTDSIIWNGGGTVFDSNNSLSGCLTQLNSDMQTLTGRAIKTVAYDTTTHTITTTKVPSGSTAQNVVTAATIVTDGGGLTSADKGVANGIAPLDANSKIDAQYLPSYVDDVIEVYARSGQTALSQNWFATGSASGTVVSPEAGKIYVLMNSGGNDYPINSQYRWGGTSYVKLNDGGCSEMTTAEMDTATNNWA